MEKMEAVVDPAVPLLRNPRFGLVVKAERAICRERRFVVRLRGWMQDRFRNAPLFTCAECGAPVFLRSSKKRRWSFSHPEHGPYCKYRKPGNREIQDIDAYRYNGQKEGPLHREMKRLVRESLAADSRFDGTKEEKRWSGTYDPNTWRKPDIQTLYNNYRIAFEMQPSSTYINVIRERRSFYLREGGVLFWIFPRFEKDLVRLYQEDVFFCNNSNLFVVDSETLRLSKESGKFTLRCHYCKPQVDGNEIRDEWHSQTVEIDELSIDQRKQEISYFDYRSARVKIQQTYTESKRTALREKLESFWIEYGAGDTKVAQSEYEPIRDALRLSGLSVPDWYNDGNFASFISLLLSAKHGRPIGYRHQKLLEVAHTAYDHHKPLLLPFGWVSKRHESDKVINAQDRSRTWARRRNTIKLAIQQRAPEFKPDISLAPILDFLFPGMGDKWAVHHKKWNES